MEKDELPTTSLEYGNIIRIIASKNSDIHEKIFFIEYLDESKIKLINTASLKPHILFRDPESGRLTDESIEEVQILSRADSPSYAQQNALLPKKWIDIHFGGPSSESEIITGEITNLEEDMIEVTTYPDLHVLYIDFEYKGIPEDLPIEKIVIRRKPASVKVSSLTKLGTDDEGLNSEQEGEQDLEGEDEEISLTMTEEGESIIRVSDRIRPEQKVREALNAQYIDANDIIFGDKVEYVEQVVEVRESERRYTLDAQTNDLMDELLSTIPDHKRTPGVLADIHLLIERYKELRAEFSTFDEYGGARGFVMLGQNHKPLVKTIEMLKQRLKWVIPVVQNRRKIYQNSLDADADADDAIFINNDADIVAQRAIDTKYRDKPRIGENSRYKTLLQEEEAAMTPFEAPLNKGVILNSTTTTEVATEFDVILDNLPDYYSTNIRIRYKKDAKEGGVSAESIDKTQYIIQRYGRGATMMEPKIAATGKPIFVRTSATPNDKMYIKSLIMMPQSVVQFSRVDLPSTNIIDRASLAQDYFMMYRGFNNNNNNNKRNSESNNPIIDKEILDNFDKEYDYEAWEQREKREFLSSIREFTVDESIASDKYTMVRFLQTIIPKTRLLIRLIDRHLTDKMSIYEMIRALEPFGIYSKDITYQHYEEMRFMIAGNANLNGKIRNYTKSLVEKKDQMAVIRNAQYRTNVKYNEVDKILYEKKPLSEIFKDGYNFPEFDKSVYISGDTMIRQMLETDYGVLYGKLLEFMRMSLTIPIRFMSEIDAVYNRKSVSELDDMGENELIRPESCARRFIAKRYTSLAQLQKDNGEEIYYDTEFDKTKYDIMDGAAIKDRQKTMTPEAFKEWLEEMLAVKHKIAKKNVDELATTLIQKKKTIRDGEYAILVISPELPANAKDEEWSKEMEIEADVRKKTQYYIRKMNNWVLDNELDPDNMYQFDNTNTLLCNIAEKCSISKGKLMDSCEDLSDAKRRIKELSRMGAKSELESRYNDDVGEAEQQLEDEIRAHLREMKQFVDHRNIMLYKANILAYEMGGMAASTEDQIRSPNAQLLQYILGQDDFIKKQNDIITFGETFCREARDYEDQFWSYCRDTNTKLLPLFLFHLASKFCFGTGIISTYDDNSYKHELDRVCREQGVLSDDGDAIVDKHSGFVIRKIDFVAEEGYDEAGFKMTTNDFMEKDIALKVKEALTKKKDRVFESENTQQIYNIAATICENLGIELVESIENFVLRTTVRWVEVGTDIMTPETYEAFAKKILDTKQKRIDNYQNYRNQLIIIFTAAAAHIAIQTQTPTVKPTAAPPAGCVRSFSGYPLEGVEDLTGIQFIACIIHKSKSKIEPWPSIGKMPAKIIALEIQKMIERYIVPLPEVVEMYFEKREYMTLHPEDIIPESLRLDKWRHFLPPIVKIHVAGGLHAVSDEVKSDLMRLLQSGSKEQHDILNRFKSSIFKHGLAVTELVNTVVSGKDAILRSASNVPFLQNACCADRQGKTPMEYFVEEDPVILSVLKKAFKMAKIVANAGSIAIPAFFYHAPNTQIIRQAMPSGHIDDNIYAAYIHYFRLDKDIPIPDELRVISAEKPAGYKPKGSLDEKIKFLKENGKRISVATFEQILKIVERKNVVHNIQVVKNTEYTVVAPFSSFLEYLATKADGDVEDLSPIFEPPLIQHLTDVIGDYDPLKMTADITELEYNLKNYLITANDKMYKIISAFLNKFGGLSRADMNKLSDFLSDIEQWSINTDQTATGLYYEEGLYTMTQFLKTSIHNMGKLYPNIIINSAELNAKAPKHWELSGFHSGDVSRFVEDYYSSLGGFKGNEILRELLRHVQVKIADLFIFIQGIPILTPITRDTQSFHNLFDKESVGLMFKYAWYTVIYECIVETDEIDLVRLDVQRGKQARRDRIREARNAESEITGGSEEYKEGYDDSGDQDDLADVDITLGDRKTIKKHTAEMLVAFLRMEHANKTILDMPYKEIERKMGRSKMEEKRLITDFFKDMDSDERQMKNMEKTFKLGRWNAQKGLVDYDKAVYDAERENLVNRILNPDATANEEVLAMERDIFGMETDEQAEIEAEYEDEANGIGHLGEDYDDGDYYGENGDDNFADT